MTALIEEGRHRDFVDFHVDDADHRYGFQYVGQRLSEGLPGIYWANLFGAEFANLIGV